MKKLVKIATSLCLCIACFVSILSFSACKKNNLVDYTITLSVSGEEKQLNVTLDKEVAPKTFEQISKLINSGFYNDAFLYKRNEAYSSQIMFGDLKFDGEGNIVQIKKDGKLPETVIGEFEKGALQGSTYKNVEGSIGLWRTWTGSGFTYSTANDTGRATIFMPTATLSEFDGYFCVFGSFDLEDESVKQVWDSIKEALSTTNVDEYIIYTVYYVEQEGKLSFNIIESEYFDSASNVYVAESNEYQCYNAYTIKVPVINKASGTLDASIKITSIKANG